MSDIELPHKEALVKQDLRAKTLETMRERLSRFMPRALDIITELAETAENERVRLTAAESILDRAGLGKTQTNQVIVSQSEHDIATREANALVERLGANKRAALLGPTQIALDALVVLEGDDDTLPTALEPVLDAVETSAV